MVIFMAVSDAAITDHNAGDDVLKYDLRSASNCFCLEGLACDPNWKSYIRKGLERSCVELGSSQKMFFSRFFLQPMTKWDAARFLMLAADGKSREPGGMDDPFLDSEQAHAFFPLFPLMIRYGALFLIRILPKTLLPPTFEGVLVLSAMLINTISFSIALLCLVDLTLRLTLPNDKALHIAGTVATLFCLNPASIFFATSYSESFFAMCTFGGYALYTSGYTYLALIPWMAASYTRSNGSLVAAWLLVEGVSRSLQMNRTMLKRSTCLTYHVLLAMAVVAPAVLHDRAGYHVHCNGELQPEWCHADMRSLYTYVQSEHWNVGFLRYYEFKQIPNFLLAAPILFCSAWGVSRWIRISWKEHVSSGDTKGGLLDCIHWATWALRRGGDESSRSHAEESILHGPRMLSHNAELAAIAMLGLTVAHVQITTRLICSTCPAIYWHLAYLCDADTKICGFSTRLLIGVYLSIFIVVGTILHVNCLPWT
jgi:phosphatidylinositol glycan class V